MFKLKFFLVIWKFEALREMQYKLQNEIVNSTHIFTLRAGEVSSSRFCTAHLSSFFCIMHTAMCTASDMTQFYSQYLKYLPKVVT